MYRRVLPNDKGQVLVIESSLNETIPDVKRLEERGAEVFVARGGSAMQLRQEGIHSPIVEIPTVSGDIAQALAEASIRARSKNPRIAVIAYANMIGTLLDFLPHLNLHLTFYTLVSDKEAPDVINTAIANGAEVILGGAITNNIAKKRDFPAVLLGSGESSIRAAYEEAKRIVYARSLEIQRRSELKAMLEHTHEGIIAVNSEGRITVFNPVAESVTGVRAKEAIGSLPPEVIPSIHFEEVLQKGNKNIGQIVDFGRSRL